MLSQEPSEHWAVRVICHNLTRGNVVTPRLLVTMCHGWSRQEPDRDNRGLLHLELIAQQVVVAFRAPPERLSHWLAHLARDAAADETKGVPVVVRLCTYRNQSICYQLTRRICVALGAPALRPRERLVSHSKC